MSPMLRRVMMDADTDHTHTITHTITHAHTHARTHRLGPILGFPPTTVLAPKAVYTVATFDRYRLRLA